MRERESAREAMAQLPAQRAVGMPVLAHALAAVEHLGDAALGRASQYAIERLQGAQMAQVGLAHSHGNGRAWRRPHNASPARRKVSRMRGQ